MSELSELLGIGAGDVVSIVGAGGKTTTMYRLARELRERGLAVVSTTTTNIQRPTARQSPAVLMQADTPDLLGAAGRLLHERGHITVVAGERRADKLAGLPRDAVAALSHVADVVLVEADGARHNAIKAPAPHEPVVPAGTTHFLSVAGLHSLGRTLAAVCHRSEIAAGIAAQAEDSVVTPETLVRLLGYPDGGLKGKPEAARAWALLTHLADENEGEARAIAGCLSDTEYEGVLALSRHGVVRLG